MKYIAAFALAAAIVAGFGNPSNAKSVWDELGDTAPRMEAPLIEAEAVAPRSVFTEIGETAPYTDFEQLGRLAP